MGRYLDLLKNVEAGPKPESAMKYRSVTPAQLAKLDVTLRVVAPLSADSWTVDDWLLWIEERASILEFESNPAPQNDGRSMVQAKQADEQALLLCTLYRRRRQS